MTNIIRRFPAASYCVLAILISWSGILAIVAPTELPAPVSESERLFPWVYLAMLAGPSAAGILVTALTGGRSALRDYRSRLFTWRVRPGWYAAATLLAPLAIGATLLLLVPFGEYRPALFSGAAGVAGPMRADAPLAMVLTALAIGLGAGFFEELGWTGVAVPRLLERRGVLWTGVAVGLVWGAWHYLAIHWGSADAIDSVSVTLYLAVALFSFLPPYRVLMTWVYRPTRSLLVGIIMHASLTTSLLILGPAVAGNQLLVFDLAFGAVLWLTALGVLAVEARRGVPSRPRDSLPHGLSRA